MNIGKIEENLKNLLNSFSKESFIYDFLLAYGLPKASVARLQKGNMNLSKIPGEILWKKKLLFKEASGDELHDIIDDLKRNPAAVKHNPRFIMVTDYRSLLAVDTKTGDSLDVLIDDMVKHYDFFLPWAGMEKHQAHRENPADVKAAERMAKLFDEIKKDNQNDSPEFLHSLNVFLSRLLFCFFAEDTGIFPKGQFTNALASHTQADGNDLDSYLDKLFDVLNLETRKDLPAFLDAFPYVNGGLFKDKYHMPKFTRRSRQAIIDSGELDWSAINPDIFGSMIQAVVSPEHRGGLGMHYTSVPNIMKVIRPLFLDALYEEFASADGNRKKLNQLLGRLRNIKIFDPACGSGNFLIIAYKELRKLEMEIFKEMSKKEHSMYLSTISLSQFYGIEIDDFAHEVAILSLWLAEHQMNVKFLKTFGTTNPTLPLKEAGHIVCGNACRLDWEEVCPKNHGDEIYILGNPPYLGSSMQSKEQKADLACVCKGFKNYKNLDFIACWFVKGAKYIQGTNAQYAFVSTNSICQGEQVALLWPYIFDKNLEIGFAYQSFKWTNNAKSNAGVTCAIIGIRNKGHLNATIYVNDTAKSVSEINAYLATGSNVVVSKRTSPISATPEMTYGNKPVDGGNLILSLEEMKQLQYKYPKSKIFIKRLVGADDLINGNRRFCLWITENNKEDAYSVSEITQRLDKCKAFRADSKKIATQMIAAVPYRFGEVRHTESTSIIIPCHSSENRNYIPMDFLTSDVIIANSAMAIYNAEPWIFGVITSRMHMTWIRAVCGCLETRIRYSATLGYNTFPFPNILQTPKGAIEKLVFRVLEERERHSEKTLAELYDPDKMPNDLREAHHQLDLAVERCYRSKPFESDEERLEYLFKLYEKMTAGGNKLYGKTKEGNY
ncbi:MAG: class I SAM-dependent DNA methyltransferase [Victivallales bacterium]|nr:class I SAM-dependent DNA methyltransferase [Victivallales bacterium]